MGARARAVERGADEGRTRRHGGWVCLRGEKKTAAVYGLYVPYGGSNSHQWTPHVIHGAHLSSTCYPSLTSFIKRRPASCLAVHCRLCSSASTNLTAGPCSAATRRPKRWRPAAPLLRRLRSAPAPAATLLRRLPSAPAPAASAARLRPSTGGWSPSSPRPAGRGPLGEAGACRRPPRDLLCARFSDGGNDGNDRDEVGWSVPIWRNATKYSLLVYPKPNAGLSESNAFQPTPSRIEMIPKIKFRKLNLQLRV